MEDYCEEVHIIEFRCTATEGDEWKCVGFSAGYDGKCEHAHGDINDKWFCGRIEYRGMKP